MSAFLVEKSTFCVSPNFLGFWLGLLLRLFFLGALPQTLPKGPHPSGPPTVLGFSQGRFPSMLCTFRVSWVNYKWV
jgi:hypothetical protein